MVDTIFVFVLKRRGAEVNQQTIINPRCIKVVDELRFMCATQNRYRFQFQNQSIFNYYICSIISHTNTFVVNWDGHLFFCMKPQCHQFNHQSVFIHLLKITSPEMTMYGHSRPNNLVTKFINTHNLVNPVNPV